MIFFFQISSLMAELEALKKEKDETAEARKKAEEQIETMRKEHEEKVISRLSSLSFLRNHSLSAKGNEHILKSVNRSLPAVVLSVPFPIQRGNGRRTRHNQCYLMPW